MTTFTLIFKTNLTFKKYKKKKTPCSRAFFFKVKILNKIKEGLIVLKYFIYYRRIHRPWFVNCVVFNSMFAWL